MNYKYLMDSNALATSQVIELLDSNFFRERCIVIDEVVYELQDTPLAPALKKISQPLEAATLAHLKIIVDDLVHLGILLTDHGNGEALLLAEALRMKHGDEEQITLDFMRNHPVIVTNEKSVDAFAKSIGIDAINSKEFYEIAQAVI